MSRVYAVREDDARRILVEIVCDGCGDKIAPGPKIAESGWMKCGVIGKDGVYANDYCPKCYRPLGTE